MFKLTDEIMAQLFGADYYQQLKDRSTSLTNGQFYDVMLALVISDLKKDQDKLLKAQVNTGGIGG